MHKPVESRGIGVFDHFGYYHSLPRDRTDHRDFILCASQRGALTLTGVHVLRFPADVSFVNFDLATQRERIAFHRGAPAMANVPASTPVSTRALPEHHAPDL